MRYQHATADSGEAIADASAELGVAQFKSSSSGQ